MLKIKNSMASTNEDYAPRKPQHKHSNRKRLAPIQEQPQSVSNGHHKLAPNQEQQQHKSNDYLRFLPNWYPPRAYMYLCIWEVTLLIKFYRIIVPDAIIIFIIWTIQDHFHSFQSTNSIPQYAHFFFWPIISANNHFH